MPYGGGRGIALISGNIFKIILHMLIQVIYQQLYYATTAKDSLGIKTFISTMGEPHENAIVNPT